MVSFDEIKRYILTIREEEMNNNYKLSESQIKLITKINQEIKKDPKLKEKIDKMLACKSVTEMNYIERGHNNIIHFNNDEVKNETKEFKDSNSVELNNEKSNQKQLVLKSKRKAGFADALIMALVTGFVGGTATTILLMLCK